MNRFRAWLAVAAALVAVVLLAPPAHAQDYPGTTPTTAAPACAITVQIDAPLAPGGTVVISILCSSILAGTTYTGTLQSTPIALPATVAQANGRVTFEDVVLPADFELGGNHTVSLVAASGASVGSATFYVDASGRIAEAPRAGASGSDLPRTGADYVEVALRWATAALAAGVVALAAARRRRTESFA